MSRPAFTEDQLEAFRGLLQATVKASQTFRQAKQKVHPGDRGDYEQSVTDLTQVVSKGQALVTKLTSQLKGNPQVSLTAAQYMPLYTIQKDMLRRVEALNTRVGLSVTLPVVPSLFTDADPTDAETDLDADATADREAPECPPRRRRVRVHDDYLWMLLFVVVVLAILCAHLGL